MGNRELVVNIVNLDISTKEEFEEKLSPVKAVLPPFVVDWNRWRSFFLRASGPPFTSSEQVHVAYVIQDRLRDVLVELDCLPENGVEH